MMPEPVPPELPELALMVTTLGEAFWAAAVTALTLEVLLTITGVYWAACALEAACVGAPHRVAAPAAAPRPGDRRPPGS